MHPKTPVSKMRAFCFLSFLFSLSSTVFAENLPDFGPLKNSQWGGALDFRVYFPQAHGPTQRELSYGAMDLHHAGLFLSTQIGEHASVFYEHVIPVGTHTHSNAQDHGYAYASFSKFPQLPESLSLKVGRFRLHYGIDAKLDSTTNILKTPVYKNLGWIADKAIEASGYFGPFDFSVGIMNGPDDLEVPANAAPATPTSRVKTVQNSKPVVGRLGLEIGDWLNFGLSAFTGRAYPVYSHYGWSPHHMTFNAHQNESLLVYKNRYAADVLMKLGSRWLVSGEYSAGSDSENGSKYNLWSVFARLDYKIIPQKLNASLQYDYFDDGRDPSSFAMTSTDTAVVGAALTYHFTPLCWLRMAHLQDTRGLFRNGDGPGPEFLTALQTMLSF